MEISNKIFRQSLFLLILTLVLHAIPQTSFAANSPPVRNGQVLERLQVTEKDNVVYAQIFFRHPVLKVWSYPEVANDVVFVYVRPIGGVPLNIRNNRNQMVKNPIFTVIEQLTVQRDTSNVLERIRYEGNIDLEGGLLVIHLSGDYVVRVQQGKKFESIVLIIRKNAASAENNPRSSKPPFQLKDVELIEAE